MVEETYTGCRWLFNSGSHRFPLKSLRFPLKMMSRPVSIIFAGASSVVIVSFLSWRARRRACIAVDLAESMVDEGQAMVSLIL